MCEPGQVFTKRINPEVAAAYLPLLLRPGATMSAFLRDDFYHIDGWVHQAIGQAILEGQYIDETELIRQRHVPVALVAGQQDPIHDLTYLGELSFPLCRNQPLIIPEAGHLVFWENTRAVNALLKYFADHCFAAS